MVILTDKTKWMLPATWTYNKHSKDLNLHKGF